MDEILMLASRADDADAIKFAHQFAHQNGKKLVVAQISKFVQARLLSRETLMYYSDGQRKPDSDKIGTYHVMPPPGNEQFHPPIKMIDASRFNENTLAVHICQNGYAMVISYPDTGRLNLQMVINQINCPVMLLPDNLAISEIKRIVYLTDLRYCQQQVINYLDKFKRSSVLLAHICEQGLPDLVPDYGNQLFMDTIRHHISSPELFYSHIKEDSAEKMVDTLISTMRTDMLVCLNRRFHFQRLLGEQVPKHLPEHISVPILVFPC